MAQLYTGEVIEAPPTTGARPYTGEVITGESVVKDAKRDAPKKPTAKDAALAPLAGPEAALAMGTGMYAKPLSDVAGMAAIPMHAMGFDREPGRVRDQVREALTYKPRTLMGQEAAENNPMALLARLLSKGGDWAADAVAPPATSGPVRAAIGEGVREAVPQAANLLGAKGSGAAADAAGGAMRSSARNWMSSALKPPLKALQTGKADRAVTTLLDEGVNVTRGGMETLQGRIDGINTRIKDIIEKSTATVDKKVVASNLKEKLNQFKKQVTPDADLRSIQKAWDEFLDHPMLPKETPAKVEVSQILDEKGKPFTKDIPASGTNKFPVQTAQELKQGTYRSLKDKAYGELKGADIEAQKTLARGLKEEIAKAVPAVRPLNARESELLNALSLVERRALMEANKNPIGLGWLNSNKAAFAGWMADRSGLFKSLVARMLNATGETLPPLGAAAAPVGAATQGQLRPPPPGP